MVEDNKLSNEGPIDADVSDAKGVDIGRRQALKNIGALAGAAPAVAVLLTPSASRAIGGGGSPCEGCTEPHGPGPGRTLGPGAPAGDAGLLGRQS